VPAAPLNRELFHSGNIFRQPVNFIDTGRARANHSQKSPEQFLMLEIRQMKLPPPRLESPRSYLPP
jgi:hypothetical protein